METDGMKTGCGAVVLLSLLVLFVIAVVVSNNRDHAASSRNDIPAANVPLTQATVDAQATIDAGPNAVATSIPTPTDFPAAVTPVVVSSRGVPPTATRTGPRRYANFAVTYSSSVTRVGGGILVRVEMSNESSTRVDGWRVRVAGLGDQLGIVPPGSQWASYLRLSNDGTTLISTTPLSPGRHDGLGMWLQGKAPGESRVSFFLEDTDGVPFYDQNGDPWSLDAVIRVSE